MSAKFPVGSVVMLRSGGPAMTVCEHVDDRESQGPDPLEPLLISVVWTHQDGTPKEATLPPACLGLADPPERSVTETDRVIAAIIAVGEAKSLAWRVERHQWANGVRALVVMLRARKGWHQLDGLIAPLEALCAEVPIPIPEDPEERP